MAQSYLGKLLQYTVVTTCNGIELAQVEDFHSFMQCCTWNCVTVLIYIYLLFILY